MAKKKQYALVVSYSFDPSMPVYLFDDMASAVNALREDFENEKRIDMEENGWDTTATIEKDGAYAKLVNHFDNSDDTTEFTVTEVSEWKGVRRDA